MRSVPKQVRGRKGSPTVVKCKNAFPHGMHGHMARLAFHVSSLPLPHGSKGHSPGGGRKAFPPKSLTMEQRTGTCVLGFGLGEAEDSGVSMEEFVCWGAGRRNNGGATAESKVYDIV